MGKIYDALEKFNRDRMRRASPEVKPGAGKTEEPGIMGPRVGDFSPGLCLDTRVDDRLICVSDPNSLATEQFKTLRSRILYPFKGSPPRAVMVTSAMVEEGKSLVAANLAISISQGISQHVLLVDCDIRRPVQHTIFNVAGDRGLSDYLKHQVPLKDLLAKTAIDKLTLLPGGMPPLNPSELLSSEKMAVFIEEVKNRYNDRIIIFDATPVQIAAEVSVLAKYVDGILLVVKRGRTDREIIERAIPVLGREKVLGVVFNGFGCFPREYNQFKSFRYA